MKPDDNLYDRFVPHPRFGSGPRFTECDPDPLDPDVHLHWNATDGNESERRYEALTGEKWPYPDLTSFTGKCRRIPGTAIKADLRRQTPATVPVTHYFDLERTCRDCARPFIFFAEEQKHWYEDLGFGLDSDCVRCVPCRKLQQGIALVREQYEELLHVQNRSAEQNLELAECCLALVEASVFHKRQTEHVRMLLNRAADRREQKRYNDLVARLRLIEAQDGEQGNAPEPPIGPVSNG